MAAIQKVNVVKKAKNSNAKYKIKYKYEVSQTGSNGIVATKYSYSKFITSLKQKYSYSL